MTRILFSGGGSIGHLAPSVAVAEAVREKESNASCLFVCAARGEDLTFLKKHSERRVPLIAPKLNNPLFIILFPLACIEAFFIILFFRPHVIFSKGGYASVPACLVGWLLRRPIVLHESDRVMGRANRFLLRFARHLCIGTPQKEIANDNISSRLGINTTATGNPVRKALLTGSADGGRRVTTFSGKRPILLVIGGSQGSQVMNEVIWDTLEKLITFCDVIHLTGRGKMHKDKKHAHYWQRETMYDELQNLYAFADIVVSRAGAGVIAELSALGKASVLVPLPELAHAHQEENAHFLEVARAVITLKQDSLRQTLVPTVQSLLEDLEKRRALGERLHGFSEMNAAERIANILLAMQKTS